MNKKNIYIPTKWYSQEELFNIEKQNVFSEKSPFYFCHESVVPEFADVYSLPTTMEEKLIVHDEDGLRVISNVCLHRQSLLVTGRAHRKHLICPVHLWKYDLKGAIESSHHVEFEGCKNLEVTNHVNWNGFVFKKTSEIESILKSANNLKSLMANYYSFGSCEKLSSSYNWKIFMETYLDLYHIQAIHPGLRKFADCSEPTWEIGDHYSIQTIGVKLKTQGENQSHNYTRYAQLIEKIPGYKSNLKITWAAIYPNVMIEIYPYNLVVSVVIPVSANKSINYVEFLFDDELKNHEFGQELHESFKAAYLETAAEDDKACELIQKGRDGLNYEGKNIAGPFHENLEAGIPSFYENWNAYMKKVG